MSTVLHRCVTSVHFYSYFLIFSVPLQGEITPHTALPLIIFINTYMSSFFAGPVSAVGNVSGYRCVSDCRSRGREFDPGPVPYFRGD